MDHVFLVPQSLKMLKINIVLMKRSEQLDFQEIIGFQFHYKMDHLFDSRLEFKFHNYFDKLLVYFYFEELNELCYYYSWRIIVKEDCGYLIKNITKHDSEIQGLETTHRSSDLQMQLPFYLVYNTRVYLFEHV